MSDWTARATRLAMLCAYGGKEFCAADIRWTLENVWNVPAPADPRAYGGIIKQLATRGLIRRVRYVCVDRAVRSVWVRT